MPVYDEAIELVIKARAGDRESFDRLFIKYIKYIYNYIYRLIGDRAVAEELAQETFVKAYINIWRFKPNARFISWLYKIAGNLAKNELRSRGYRAEVSLDKSIPGNDENIALKDILSADIKPADLIIENAELKERIERALSSLSVNEREVIILCVIQKMSYAEAAQTLACSKQAVADRLSRARKSFIRLMGADYSGKPGE